MNDERYKQLVEKLNTIMLNADDESRLSHLAIGRAGAGMASPALYITKDMDVEKLSKNEVTLAHTLLHKFYSTGSKSLTKENIEQLHEKISKKLQSHSHFDRLDKE